MEKINNKGEDLLVEFDRSDDLNILCVRSVVNGGPSLAWLLLSEGFYHTCAGLVLLLITHKLKVNHTEICFKQ